MFPEFLYKTKEKPVGRRYRRRKTLPLRATRATGALPPTYRVPRRVSEWETSSVLFIHHTDTLCTSMWCGDLHEEVGVLGLYTYVRNLTVLVIIYELIKKGRLSWIFFDGIQTKILYTVMFDTLLYIS